MPATGIAGMMTTFNTPNYVGELFGVTPTDTPFLSAIGGLTGGEQTNSTIFTWQSYDLRDPDINRQRLEGATAPDAEARPRTNAFNVVEIHQESLEISYTRQAATGQFASTGSAVPTSAGIDGAHPPADELTWQTQRTLEQIARDIEKTFIVGQFAQPTDNTAPRKTRGLLEAIETNVVSALSSDTTPVPTELTADLVIDLLQKVWENGGLRVSETATLMCNAYQKRLLTKAFITDRNYREQTRNVGGVNLQTVETDFGQLNLMLNRHMPKDQVVVVSMDECAPVFLNVPGRGFLFQEPLAKTGSSQKYQIYGEVGLRYGNELAHGKITDLTTAPA